MLTPEKPMPHPPSEIDVREGKLSELETTSLVGLLREASPATITIDQRSFTFIAPSEIRTLYVPMMYHLLANRAITSAEDITDQALRESALGKAQRILSEEDAGRKQVAIISQNRNAQAVLLWIDQENSNPAKFNNHLFRFLRAGPVREVRTDARGNVLGYEQLWSYARPTEGPHTRKKVTTTESRVLRSPRGPEIHPARLPVDFRPAKPMQPTPNRRGLERSRARIEAPKSIHPRFQADVRAVVTNLSQHVRKLPPFVSYAEILRLFGKDIHSFIERKAKQGFGDASAGSVPRDALVAFHYWYRQSHKRELRFPINPYIFEHLRMIVEEQFAEQLRLETRQVYVSRVQYEQRPSIDEVVGVRPYILKDYEEIIKYFPEGSSVGYSALEAAYGASGAALISNLIIQAGLPVDISRLTPEDAVALDTMYKRRKDKRVPLDRQTFDEIRTIFIEERDKNSAQ